MDDKAQTVDTVQLDADIQQILREEIEQLTAEMQDRFHEIAVLTGMLEDAEARHAAAMAHQEMVLTRRYEVTQFLAQAAQAIGANSFAAGMPSLDDQRAALKESELFDAAWYLETHADVAQAKITPEDHYLQAGAFEGRDPGPGFSSQAYYMANPDVAQAGWPALSHYLMLGQSENRAQQLEAPETGP